MEDVILPTFLSFIYLHSQYNDKMFKNIQISILSQKIKANDTQVFTVIV